MKPTDVVGTLMDLEKGLANVVAGQVASDRIRRFAVAILKQTDSEAYAAYKAAKYPGGAATPESRRKAYALALARVSEIALQFYVRET